MVITFEVGAKLMGYLEQLLDTGLYGASEHEVAERLMCARIGQLIDADTVHVWEEEEAPEGPPQPPPRIEPAPPLNI